MPQPSPRTAPAQIAQWVDDALRSTPVYDLHTHLYPANFGRFNLWGIDELLNYHYLIAETLRLADVSYDAFWAMPRGKQNDLIWQTLFLDHAPISEACRGVLTVLHRLGIDLSSPSLNDARAFFRDLKAADYVDRVLKLANVQTVVMTND